MIGALWNGMTGITSYDRGIAVESNNAANVSTVGHKQDQITFEDLLYTQGGYGKGVATQSISKQFEQGSIRPTNSSIDVAIDGKGFFILSEASSGKVYYSRAGNFVQAENGFLQSQNGMNILGITPQAKNVVTTNPNEKSFSNEYLKNLASINISSDKTVYNINARTTDYIKSAVSDSIANSGNNFKTSGSKINDVELMIADYAQKLKLFQSNPNSNSLASTTQSSKVDFSSAIADLQNENDYLSIKIDNQTFIQQFDTDVATTLKKMSDKISNFQGFISSVDSQTGIFTINNIAPGKEFRLSDAKINEVEAEITKIQNATKGSGLAMVDSSKNALKAAIEKADGKFLEITNVINYGNTNNMNSGINLRLDALTLVNDAKGEVSIRDDGFVFVSIEGNDFLVGKIGTVNFKNEGGLLAVGDNMFSSTRESGAATNADSTNKIVSKFLENANISLGDTLTSLMIYQKAFEANSKSITTGDEFLKTAMDMIR